MFGFCGGRADHGLYYEDLNDHAQLRDEVLLQSVLDRAEPLGSAPTLRAKLFKSGAVIIRNTRRVRVMLSSAYSCQGAQKVIKPACLGRFRPLCDRFTPKPCQARNMRARPARNRSSPGVASAQQKAAICAGKSYFC